MGSNVPAGANRRASGSQRAMHPHIHAKAHPDRPAYIMAGSGEVVTYRQLDERSNRGAHLCRSLRPKASDVIAILMDNHPG